MVTVLNGPRPITSETAAFAAGIEYGRAERVRADIAEAVAETLHEMSRYWLGFARAEATHRHGPAWADLICGDDE